MSNERSEDDVLVPIGVLWRSESGKALTGKLGDARLVVLENRFKEPGSRQPDYRVFVSKHRQDEGQGGGAQGDNWRSDKVPF